MDATRMAIIFMLATIYRQYERLTFLLVLSNFGFVAQDYYLFISQYLYFMMKKISTT